MSDDRPDEATGGRVQAVVRDVLAPLIAVDGGEIELLRVEGGVAEIALRGACAGCPGQTFTTRQVVLPVLKTVDPTIESVRVTVAVV